MLQTDPGGDPTSIRKMEWSFLVETYFGTYYQVEKGF